MKLLVEEDGSKLVERAVRDADVVAALVLTYVDARAALARMRAGGRWDGDLRAAALDEGLALVPE